MASINAHGYIRIKMGLFSNSISFASLEEDYIVGEALLQFVYCDIARLLNRANYKKEDFSPLHPYFECCDETWMNELLLVLNSRDDENPSDYIEKLLQLQCGYMHILTTLFGGSSYPDAKRIGHILSQENDIRKRSCYNLCSLTNTNEDKCVLDYFFTSFEEVLHFEFIELLRRRISLIKCKNCGRLFIPKRSNSEYCQRVYTADGKTCAEIGYAQSFSRTVRNDELLSAYTKAYKAHYARMTKPRKRVKNMSRDEFSMWYREAKEKLNQARAGLIDPEEYKEWLKL